MDKLSLLPIRNFVTMRGPTRTFIGNASACLTKKLGSGSKEEQ
jgi:hypothetical protein